jgi:drug/metabolite transporter (DMT)-like permease
LFFTGRLSCAVGVEKGDIGILFLKSCIVGASWTATYFALKTLPITCAAPIRSTGPLWTFIGAVILFSEVPTALQGVGMVLVMGGCLFFSRSSSKEKSSGGAKAVALAFLGTVLGSCSALYDKYLLQGCSISSLTLLWWFLAGMCVIFAVAAAVTREKFEFRWTMPLTGIMLAFSDACYFNAIADPVYETVEKDREAFFRTFKATYLTGSDQKLEMLQKCIDSVIINEAWGVPGMPETIAAAITECVHGSEYTPKVAMETISGTCQWYIDAYFYGVEDEYPPEN